MRYPAIQLFVKAITHYALQSPHLQPSKYIHRNSAIRTLLPHLIVQAIMHTLEWRSEVCEQVEAGEHTMLKALQGLSPSDNAIAEARPRRIAKKGQCDEAVVQL